MKAKHITTMGIAIALLFVTGYVVYLITKPLLLPGAKFLLMAPLLSFLQFFPMALRPKGTSLLLLNLGFAAILAVMSPLMSIAILLSGLFSAGVYGLLRPLIKEEQAIHWSLSAYPPFAMLVSFYISVEITGLNIYGDQWNLLVALVALGCLALGRVGTHAAHLFVLRTHIKPFETKD